MSSDAHPPGGHLQRLNSPPTSYGAAASDRNTDSSEDEEQWFDPRSAEDLQDQDAQTDSDSNAGSDTNKSDPSGFENPTGIHIITRRHRVDFSRRQNTFAPPKRSAQVLWKDFHAGNNAQKINYVAQKYRDEVTDEIRSIIARRMKQKEQFPLDGSQIKAWENFTTLFSQIEKTFVLMTPQHKRDLVNSEWHSLVRDTYSAFNWPSLAVIWIPDANGGPPEAKMIAIQPDGAPSWVDWQSKADPRVWRLVNASFQGYANQLYQDQAKEDMNAIERELIAEKKRPREKASKKAVETQVNPQEDRHAPHTTVFTSKEGDFTSIGEREGVRIIENIRPGMPRYPNLHLGRTILRFLISDRYASRRDAMRPMMKDGKLEAPTIPWKRISRHLTQIAYSDYFPKIKDEAGKILPPELPFYKTSCPSKQVVDAWLTWFADIQDGGNETWEHGMIFKQTLKNLAIKQFGNVDNSDNETRPNLNSEEPSSLKTPLFLTESPTWPPLPLADTPRPSLIDDFVVQSGPIHPYLQVPGPSQSSDLQPRNVSQGPLAELRGLPPSTKVPPPTEQATDRPQALNKSKYHLGRAKNPDTSSGKPLRKKRKLDPPDPDSLRRSERQKQPVGLSVSDGVVRIIK